MSMADTGAGTGERVVVAMSGGVDSSVAALMALERGWDPVGVFLRSGVEAAEAPGRKLKQGCCSVADAIDARRVADTLGIPFYALDYTGGFDRLIDHFVESYERGETPSPCVLCNTWLKFGELLAFAEGIGADAVVTGHYARRADGRGGRAGLARATDRQKDQSYFLAGLSQEQLRGCLFPLGDMTKEQVRDRARAAGLRTAEKPESMEICFVPGGDYRELLRRKRPGSLRPGEIVAEDGRVLGRHDGHQGFTVGQRRGLGIGGEAAPLYVTRTEPGTNRVFVGPRNLLARRGLTAHRVTWVSMAPPPVGEPVRCAAQVRHRHAPASATAVRRDDDTIEVRFDEPVDAVAPGQAVALFAGDLVLAGGWIART
jgi:tRNA-specific 2-thiouridylase